MGDAERGLLLIVADRQTRLQRPCLQGGFHRCTQMRRGRQDQLKRHSVRPQPAERLAEHLHVVADFAAPAARQHQQHGRRRITPPLLAGIRPQRRELLDQRMADIRAWRTAEIAMGLGFERQQRQDMVDIPAHGAGPARSPRPDRRRDVIHDRDRRISLADAPCHTMGKIRTVDDHQHVGLRLQGRLRDLADAPQDQRQFPRDRGQPHDRELLDRKQRRQSLRSHVTATNPGECHIAAAARAQRRHQRTAEPIAGFFGRDQEDLARQLCHLAGTPVTNRPALSAMAIMVCGSATMARPATIATPDNPAAIAPSMVFGPKVGRSNRRSCVLLGALTSTPRPGLARTRPCSRSRTMRASKPSVPSMSSTATTCPSITTSACPMSNGLMAYRAARPFSISLRSSAPGGVRAKSPSGITRSGATSWTPISRNPCCSKIRPMPDRR